MAVLSRAPRSQLDGGTDSVAIGAGALDLDFQPVRRCWAIVQPDLCGRAQRSGYDVEPAVAVEVPDRRSAMTRWWLRGQTSLRGQRLKLGATQIAKHRVGLVDHDLRRDSECLHVPTCDEDIFAAVVVEIR